MTLRCPKGCTSTEVVTCARSSSRASGFAVHLVWSQASRRPEQACVSTTLQLWFLDPRSPSMHGASSSGAIEFALAP